MKNNKGSNASEQSPRDLQTGDEPRQPYRRQLFSSMVALGVVGSLGMA